MPRGAAGDLAFLRVRVSGAVSVRRADGSDRLVASPGDPIDGGALTSVSPTFLAIDGRGRVAFLGVVAGARAVVVADATGLHVLAPRIPDFVTAFAPG